MRYLSKNILKDLKKKMVFIGGPRQVGKTTLAKHFLKNIFSDGRYFNWDYTDDRHDLLAGKWQDNAGLVVFDELHKYRDWKNWIKGIYDTNETNTQFLVTGSARLDVYKKGGDSLLGRYHYWRLHPFGLDEYPSNMTPKEAFDRLMSVGGFPEPFLDGDEREARRWRRERFDRVIKEDIRDLGSIRQISLLDLFIHQLRTRVGNLIVMSNLAGEIQVSPKTIANWLDVLERMYLVFAVRPYTKNLPRAVIKPPKVFFYDNADVIGNQGAVFENLVATQLLKKIHLLEDTYGYRYELRYIRDKEGREVDFVILKDGLIEELIEVKHSKDSISKHLKYYAEKLNPKKATQIVANLKHPYSSGKINVIDPIRYFQKQSGLMV
ncbi:MAG: ATP-binding protein [Desulfobacteraceae bacterium]|nr:ATP-binding protein [Desulfobacteraceae bacterium]